jgi:hypothetical protein
MGSGAATYALNAYASFDSYSMWPAHSPSAVRGGASATTPTSASRAPSSPLHGHAPRTTTGPHVPSPLAALSSASFAASLAAAAAAAASLGGSGPMVPHSTVHAGMALAPQAKGMAAAIAAVSSLSSASLDAARSGVAHRQASFAVSRPRESTSPSRPTVAFNVAGPALTSTASVDRAPATASSLPTATMTRAEAELVVSGSLTEPSNHNQVKGAGGSDVNESKDSESEVEDYSEFLNGHDVDSECYSDTDDKSFVSSAAELVHDLSEEHTSPLMAVRKSIAEAAAAAALVRAARHGAEAAAAAAVVRAALPDSERYPGESFTVITASDLSLQAMGALLLDTQGIPWGALPSTRSGYRQRRQQNILSYRNLDRSLAPLWTQAQPRSVKLIGTMWFRRSPSCSASENERRAVY